MAHPIDYRHESTDREAARRSWNRLVAFTVLLVFTLFMLGVTIGVALSD